jgi:hypothetical protein
MDIPKMRLSLIAALEEAAQELAEESRHGPACPYELTDEQVDGIKKAIEELDAGKGIPHVRPSEHRPVVTRVRREYYPVGPIIIELVMLSAAEIGIRQVSSKEGVTP